MQIFQRLEKYRHEQVIFAYQHDAGLKAIIAVHDTTLGPALGGVRMYPYKSDEDALQDVLRLARGMTFKAAAAGLNLGGGKAVIIGDPKRDKSEMLFRAFGKAVNALGGRYITAEDVGTDVYDMEFISRETEYVTGIDVARGGSGDPSPFTAFGTLQGMKACLERVWGNASFAGRTVAVQGLGHVGQNLVRLLVESGATVFGADVDQDAIDQVRSRFPQVEMVDAKQIVTMKCDIFAPCAMGAVINDDTIDRIQAKVIAGAANNQLAREEHGKIIARRGIIYAPDYVINAGGLMNVYVELEGYSRERAYRIIRSIHHNIRRIFKLADAEGISTAEAADRVAVQRMHEVGRLSVCFNTFQHRRQQSRGVPSDLSEPLSIAQIEDTGGHATEA